VPLTTDGGINPGKKLPVTPTVIKIKTQGWWGGSSGRAKFKLQYHQKKFKKKERNLFCQCSCL
jgi:hypothetical protein